MAVFNNWLAEFLKIQLLLAFPCRDKPAPGLAPWPDYFVSLLLAVIFIFIVDAITDAPLYPPPPSLGFLVF